MAEIDPPPPDRIKFFYVKSSQFRVMHVDGALGGITPRGNVHIAIYSERAAIPQSTTHELMSNGHLGEEHVVEGKNGIVRELDADLIMSRRTAVELRDWLNQRIEELDTLKRSAVEHKDA